MWKYLLVVLIRAAIAALIGGGLMRIAESVWVIPEVWKVASGMLWMGLCFWFVCFGFHRRMDPFED